MPGICNWALASIGPNATTKPAVISIGRRALTYGLPGHLRCPSNWVAEANYSSFTSDRREIVATTD